jgi:hypothetical protein
MVFFDYKIYDYPKHTQFELFKNKGVITKRKFSVPKYYLILNNSKSKEK